MLVLTLGTAKRSALKAYDLFVKLKTENAWNESQVTNVQTMFQY